MRPMSTGNTTILSAEATARFLGHCNTCDRPVAATVEDTHGDHATIACPDCGAGCPGQRLYGTLAVAHCNSACEGARGPVCTCACAGANHGGAWAKPGTMLADQLAAYRADKARLVAQAQKRRDARRAANQNAHTLWRSAHEDVVDYLTTGDIAWSDFLTDLADQLDTRGELTAGQVEAVRRNITRQAARDAARAAEATRPTMPVPAGHAVNITGNIVKVEVKDNPYGRGGRRVMTVRDDRGFKVQGTVPTALTDEIALSELTGRRVRFTADIKPGDRDPAFGFFARPARAEILDPTAAA